MASLPPFPTELPSPPRGFQVAPSARTSWLRRVVTTCIAHEPADAPGRLTVAATVLANLSNVVTAAFGGSLLSRYPALLRVDEVLTWPLAVGIMAFGFMSRSRTARFLANLTAVGVVSLFVADRLGVPWAAISAGIWAYHTAVASTLGVWLARAVRRRIAQSAG